MFTFTTLITLLTLIPTSSASHASVSKSLLFASVKSFQVNDDLLMLPKDYKGGFEEAFNYIAQKYKVTVLSEGEPFTVHLSNDAVIALQLALKNKLSVEEMVAEVALAFDYESEQVNNKAFVLRKIYTKREDLPYVTPEEIRNFLSNFLSESKSVFPQPFVEETKPFSIQLAESITPEQLAKINNSLSLAELSPEQQRMAVAAAWKITLSDAVSSVLVTLRHFQFLDNTETSFQWMKIANQDVFGYSGPFGPKNILWQFPMSQRYISMTSGGYYQIPKKMLGNSETNNAASNDPTVPTAEDREFIASHSVKHKTTLTVQELLSPRFTSTPLTITRGLEDKPLSVFGLEFASNELLVRSVAAVYGLRLLVDEKRQFTLTYPTRRSLKDASQLSSEIERLMPLPLQRSLAGQSRRLREIARNKEATQMKGLDRVHRDPVREAARKATHETMLDSQVRLTITQSYYMPAVRRLRLLVEPKMPDATAKPILVSSLGGKEHNLITLMRISDGCLLSLYKITDIARVRCLMEPDRFCIQAAPNKEGKLAGINFGYQDENGKFHSELGTSIPAY